MLAVQPGACCQLQGCPLSGARQGNLSSEHVSSAWKCAQNSHLTGLLVRVMYVKHLLCHLVQSRSSMCCLNLKFTRVWKKIAALAINRLADLVLKTYAQSFKSLSKARLLWYFLEIIRAFFFFFLEMMGNIFRYTVRVGLQEVFFSFLGTGNWTQTLSFSGRHCTAELYPGPFSFFPLDLTFRK